MVGKNKAALITLFSHKVEFGARTKGIKTKFKIVTFF